VRTCLGRGVWHLITAAAALALLLLLAVAGELTRSRGPPKGAA
jgi:hypothetical protein